MKIKIKTYYVLRVLIHSFMNVISLKKNFIGLSKKYFFMYGIKIIQSLNSSYTIKKIQ